MTMTEISQRIAVATFDGWVNKPVPDGYSFKDPSEQIIVDRWVDHNNIPHRKVPEYLDEDPFTEVLERAFTVNPQLLPKYESHLMQICARDFDAGYRTFLSVSCASKAQKVEAFLRAINKWLE